MTWFLEDTQERVAFGGTKARQRWDNLRRDCRQAMEMGEYYILVLWPMSGWQIWRRVDKVWVEYQKDCSTMQEAIEAAQQLIAERK
jgi:hypothetical protein